MEFISNITYDVSGSKIVTSYVMFEMNSVLATSSGFSTPASIWSCRCFSAGSVPPSAGFRLACVLRYAW